MGSLSCSIFSVLVPVLVGEEGAAYTAFMGKSWSLFLLLF